MAQIPPEIIEQILIRSDVEDLIRFKSVRKSWKFLISNPDFIKAHLEHSYRRDRENDNIGNRRIVMSGMGSTISHRILGSSNGLVCICLFCTDFLVVNPETREVRELEKPRFLRVDSLTYGFGYDSSKDDYKVILGFKYGSYTLFQKYTLKSQIWESIGELNFTSFSPTGVLYNGALHWVAYRGYPHNKEKVILSYNLSENEFYVIPQPDDVRYHNSAACRLPTCLGTMGDCLCVIIGTMFACDIWVMKEYNVKQSWELQSWEIWGPQYKIKPDTVHQLKELEYYNIPNKRFVRTPEFIGAPLYMPSLVSPHVCRESKIKRRETSTTKSRKVPKLCVVHSWFK